MGLAALQLWEDAKDNPPRKGYHIVWKEPVFGDEEEGLRVAFFDGYSKWRESSAPHSTRITVSHWMETPEKPQTTNCYPSDKQLKNETIRDAAESLYAALRQYQTVVALLEETC
jgi:hypothetical protein